MSLQHFKIVQELAQGEQSVVRLAQRIADCRLYALKETNLRHASPRERLRVLREVELLGSVDHPNIVRQYDAFIQEGRMIQVLEPGLDGNLATVLSEKGALPEETVWRICLQLLSALHYLDSIGVISRTIQPRNVLLSGDRVLLTGFDFFCHKGEAQPDRVGSPEYWAPELWYTTEHGATTETYALGCVLYECCVGKRTFSGSQRSRFRETVLDGVHEPLPDCYSAALRQLIQATVYSEAGAGLPASSLLQSGLIAHHRYLYNISNIQGRFLCKYEPGNTRHDAELSAALDGSRRAELRARAFLPPSSYLGRSQVGEEEVELKQTYRKSPGNPSPKAVGQLRGRARNPRPQAAMPRYGYRGVRKAVVVGNLRDLLSIVRDQK